MYIIFAFAIGLSCAGATPIDLGALYHELQNTPPRARQNRTAEAVDFAAKLRTFLELRAQTGRMLGLGPLLDAMAKYSELGPEISEVFATLAHPDNGLSAREVAALMMSGKFLDHHGTRLTPARAFKRALRMLPCEPVQIDRRQFEIFAELAQYANGIEDWNELAEFVADWPELKTLVSDALVSRLLPQLFDWRLTPTQWNGVLALYHPEFIDDVECALIVKHFGRTHALLRALGGVRDEEVRMRLQMAAVRGCKRPSQGLVRTLLRPIGEYPGAHYRMSLARFEEQHLKRAWRTDCGTLLVAAVNDDPRLPPRSKETPTFLRVIEGGLKSSP